MIFLSFFSFETCSFLVAFSFSFLSQSTCCNLEMIYGDSVENSFNEEASTNLEPYLYVYILLLL